MRVKGRSDAGSLIMSPSIPDELLDQVNVLQTAVRLCGYDWLVAGVDGVDVR
jgi:hypothetical protein